MGTKMTELFILISKKEIVLSVTAWTLCNLSSVSLKAGLTMRVCLPPTRIPYFIESWSLSTSLILLDLPQASSDGSDAEADPSEAPPRAPTPVGTPATAEGRDAAKEAGTSGKFPR